MSDVVGQIALELGIDSSQIINQLTGASNKAAKQATSIFSGMGKKIAGALSIAAFTKFTKDCIEVGSNVTEVQNVVDTAFKDLSGQADQWASNAMTNFGLSELSAKKYMGVFGQMSNAMGITGKAALDMAENVTGLTGDVASFYNLGTDEAYTKLKSIWTGETETLKDLGVVMTQTNLDQYALNNGFGKTTAKMTEQEKVMLRYQYVTSSLSNATGDFVKTQDSWANQTRILSLRFEQLKASLGKGFIALFTPILRGINACLAGLQILADKFTSFIYALTGQDISASTGAIQADLSNIGDTATDTAGNISGVGSSTKKTAKEIERSLASFDKITKLDAPQSDNDSSGAGVGGGIGGGSLPSLSKDTKDTTNTVNDFANKVKEALEPLKAINFDNLIQSLGNLKEACKPLTEKLFDGLKWAYYNIFVPLAKWTIEDLLPAFLDVLAGVLKVLNSALDALKPLWDWAWNNFFKPIAEWTGGVIINVLHGLRDALNGISEWIDNNQKLFDAIVITIGAFAAAWKAVELAEFIMNAGGIVGIINKMKTAIEACTVAKVADKWETVKICALYTKDFVVNMASATKELAKQAAEWIKLTALKIKDKAVDMAKGLKDFVVNMALATKELISQGIQWTVQTASKVADTAATAAHTAATWLATAATTAFGVAMSVLTSPITLVIAALAALALGIYELVKHWDVVKETAVAVWDAIVGAWSVASGWFNDNVIKPIASFFSGLWSGICNIFGGTCSFFTNLFAGAANGIKSAFSSITGFFSGIWAGICNTFGNVAGWFRDRFSQAWQAVKDVFSAGGRVFDGIKDGILSGLKSVVNALISGINKVISIPFNGINNALNGIKNINILGAKPFGWLPTISVPQIPRLAQGGYVKPNTPQLAMIGDNRHQGEVVAPEDKLIDMAQKAAAMASSTELLAEAISILKQILKVLEALNLDIQLDGKSLKKYVVDKINEHTKQTGKCEIIT